MLREMGLPYAAMEKNGISLPVVEAHCKYMKGARYDDLITIKSFLKEKPMARIKIEYEVFNASKKEILAIGYTIHSFVNSNGKPTRPPKEFQTLVRGLI